MRNPKELKEENIEIVFFFAFRYILPFFPTLKEKEENSALPTTPFHRTNKKKLHHYHQCFFSTLLDNDVGSLRHVETVKEL
jgi:hypothetical protein